MPDTHPPSRIVVAMSGGVDSSVAAALLAAQGHEVIGLMLRLWSEPGQAAHNRCCTPDQMARARQVAEQIGIPFYAIDVQATFRQQIVQFYLDESEAGRTPNPCLECNRGIRFGYLLNHALALGADYLATGHYARLRQSANGYELHTAVDRGKDQSYVLHVLDQSQLARAVFPVGEFTKPQVRQLAQEFRLPVAFQSESMDLCFLGKGSGAEFLRRHLEQPPAPGPIVDTRGVQLGQHTGLPFYTIGQRKGLGISGPTPLFVVAKDAERNALIVGTRDELGQTDVRLRRVNWIASTPPDAPLKAHVKIRYTGPAMPAVITPDADNTAWVRFDEPAAGVAPGQGAVFYEGSRCLGGGIIADLKAPLQAIAVAGESRV